MNTIAERLKSARERLELSQADLAALAGVSQGTIGNIESGLRKEPRELLAIARAVQVLPEWLKSGRGPRTVLEIVKAHPMSPDDVKLTPQIKTVQWGLVVPSGLPEVFEVAVPDDAMSPRVRAGQTVIFDTREKARPGDGVLVSDSDGAWFFRLYRQGRGGAWEAHAENPAYQTLDSVRDGLTVLAVLSGVKARWG